MMKLKNFITFLVIAVVLAFSAMPVQAAMQDMWAKVYSWDGDMTADGRAVLTEITSGVMFVVMVRNSDATPETLTYYGSDAYTSLANPVTGTSFASDTICNDRVAFRVDPTETNDIYVDLIVVDQAGGYTSFVEDFDQYTHTIVIDQRLNVRHHGAAFIRTSGSSSEIDTGIDFDDDSIVDDMIIEVGTAFPTNTNLSVGILSSGTNGDANGFVVDRILATAGYITLNEGGIDLTLPIASTGGERPAIINDTGIGTYLGNFMLGTSDTDISNPAGHLVRHGLIIHGTWENSLTYTFGTTACSTGWGMIHFWFTRIK